MESNIDSFIVLHLLEMGLNYVHEAAHSVYLRHVYSNKVAETFLGDELFGTNRTIPIEDKVDNAVKRVHQLSTATKSAIGQTCRVTGSTNKWGSSGRRGDNNYNGDRHQYDRHRDYDYDPRPSAFPSFG
jgi:hypothetical protein